MPPRRLLLAILAVTSLASPQALLAACPNFGAAAHYPAGTSPKSVAVGDFNGDGKPDYAAANSGSGDVSIRLGDGSGGFAAGTLAADFNRDGRIDLATSNRGSNTVSILIGDGLGGFAASVPYAVGVAPRKRPPR